MKKGKEVCWKCGKKKALDPSFANPVCYACGDKIGEKGE
jgi:hypothetical protein